MEQTWLITGSSRGLGRALVEAAIAAGDTVAATARQPEQLDDLAAA
jgi:NAD(P)-dependent dehydrogenase (short-subunit alcohol dehydrogenase family)